MKTVFFPIQSSSLAHYLGSAIIKPAKYFTNKPHDIQDRFSQFLLFTSRFGTTETDCCLEIVLTDEEIKVLINLKDGWFLFDEKPLPITRVKKIYFSDRDKQNVTITNIRMSTAYVPDTLIELHHFDDNPSTSIVIPPECYGVEQEDNIEKFDKYLGALALMKTAGEPYMNYSQNYISTLSLFNSIIKEQISKISDISFNYNFQGIFTCSRGFEKILPYLSKHIDEEVLNKIANEEKQEILKDKITRVIDLNSINENSWTYIIAILNTYSVGEESRKKRVDGLILSHFSDIKKGKAEGVALCYGYNRGYTSFTKNYKKDDNVSNTDVSYKYKLVSQLDYYTIESVYQYIFNNRISAEFPYLDEWCPKQYVAHATRKTDYIILDEIIIGKKKAQVFSEEWWNGLLPRFNKEFARFSNESFLFFKELGNEMKEDLEDERKELILSYEKKLNENNKKIDSLTKQLENYSKGNMPTQDLDKTVCPSNAEDIIQKCLYLKNKSITDLRKIAKQDGLIIPNKASKEVIDQVIIKILKRNLFSQQMN